MSSCCETILLELLNKVKQLLKLVLETKLQNLSIQEGLTRLECKVNLHHKAVVQMVKNQIFGEHDIGEVTYKKRMRDCEGDGALGPNSFDFLDNYSWLKSANGDTGQKNKNGNNVCRERQETSTQLSNPLTGNRSHPYGLDKHTLAVKSERKNDVKQLKNKVDAFKVLEEGAVIKKRRDDKFIPLLNFLLDKNLYKGDILVSAGGETVHRSAMITMHPGGELCCHMISCYAGIKTTSFRKLVPRNPFRVWCILTLYQQSILGKIITTKGLYVYYLHETRYSGSINECEKVGVTHSDMAAIFVQQPFIWPALIKVSEWGRMIRAKLLPRKDVEMEAMSSCIMHEFRRFGSERYELTYECTYASRKKGKNKADSSRTPMQPSATTIDTCIAMGNYSLGFIMTDDDETSLCVATPRQRTTEQHRRSLAAQPKRVRFLPCVVGDTMCRKKCSNEELHDEYLVHAKFGGCATNYEKHWYLAVIDLLARCVFIYDPLPDKAAVEECTFCCTTDQKDELALTTVNTNPIHYNVDWIIDSGCSNHMTGDKRKLTKLTEYKGGRVVVTADNSRLPITHIGNATILPRYNSNQVELQHVYHVSGIKKNLLSVSQLKASLNFVLFGPDEVKVYQNKKITGTPIIQGKRMETMYVMSAQEAYVDKIRKNETPNLWYAKLGHVSYHKLKIMMMKSMLN
ncbi:hypothetical protein ACH5RR_030296 [Cinchona calisaya]|uniref:Retrovirus-related Pol polyprotein from transposon TNT 1-94-like beta-barrel domain-containing protein n=1 Tax=Cinchona calisaya TaxID=153742 RepID=A0ABD2YXW2_9GENT